MKVTRIDTYYTKTQEGYEIVEEIDTTFDLEDGEEFPQDDWLSELHQVSYS
jgi:hypothetical protein